MPSPFPGMNPYLEHPDVWSSVHAQSMSVMAERLAAQVRPDYLVHIEAHLWIHELFEDPDDRASKRRLLGRSDVSISGGGLASRESAGQSEAQTALLTPPARISIP